MRNRITEALAVAALGWGLAPDAALALDGTDALNPSTIESYLGNKCYIQRIAIEAAGKLVAGVLIEDKSVGEEFYAGASRYKGGGVPLSEAPITKEKIEECLGVSAGSVEYLVQDGADKDTSLEDDLIGFGFVLNETAGEFVAGTFYKFTIGKGSLTPPPPSAGNNSAPSTTSAQQSLSSTLGWWGRYMSQARSRFASSRRQQGGDGARIGSRNYVPFDIDGTFTAQDGVAGTQGSFFEQIGTFDGSFSRLVSGDFNVQLDSTTGASTATGSGRVAWERMASDDTMLGVFLGGELAHSSLGDDIIGKRNSYGLSAGGYAVTTLRESLFIDGFVSVGMGRNDLEMTIDDAAFGSDYTTRTIAIGGSLTGVIEREGYEIQPELAVSYGKSFIGDLNFTDADGTAMDDMSVDATTVSMANVLLRPEFRVPLDGLSTADSSALFTFAPRAICERTTTATTTQNCGAGAEIGLSSNSEDGLSSANIRFVMDRVGNSNRSNVVFNVEHRF